MRNNSNKLMKETGEKLDFTSTVSLSKTETVELLPKIVGETRHYPPANKEWKNSTYAFNKNNIRSLPALDKMVNKTIKGYFNMSDNKKLARSKRMRNLIRRSTVKRLFVSRPEIKQTSDKVNITIYTFNREKQFLLRKMYFYNRNMHINKDIYLYKLWLKKNLMAFQKTFTGTESSRLGMNSLIGQGSYPLKPIKTNRNLKNKTYVHNVLLNKYLSNNSSLTGNISQYKMKPNSNKASAELLNKKIFRRSLYKVLKNRSEVKFLKKRAMKKGFRRITGLCSLTPANNYFANKVTKKVKLTLRNKYNLVKIQQKLKNLKKNRYGKIRLPYSNLKFTNEIKFFSFRLVSELKYIRKLFFYYFIKYLLSLFQIKMKIEKKNSRLNRLIYEFTVLKGDNMDKAVVRINKKLRLKYINRYSYDKLKNIEKLNLELLNFFKLTLAEGGLNKDIHSKRDNHLTKEKLDSLYQSFERKYFLTFLSKFFKKEFLYLNYYSKFLLNQLKFGKFLPGLKLLISKIYSKKVELNLVNLKYPHLNSDIYTESIATKLRKKVGLLRVLRWSLKLARLPYAYYSNNNAANLNKLSDLSTHKSSDVISLTEASKKSIELAPFKNGSGDRLQAVLSNLFPHTLARSFSEPVSRFNEFSSEKSIEEKTTILGQRSLFAKNIGILNILRYKWVSGVRLEAAGRLTRRYTAARSVFKYRYKGNLKNIDYSLKTDTSKKNISTVMLRNYAKSNSQYTFTKSKRRIGAFGLKGWISSY